MNFLKFLVPCLGSAVLLCPAAFAQSKLTQSKVVKPAASHTLERSSSLGGPITPTQPNFFSDASGPLQPGTSQQPQMFDTGPLTLSPERKPAPMIDDPPHPTGGFLKVELR